MEILPSVGFSSEEHSLPDLGGPRGSGGTSGSRGAQVGLTLPWRQLCPPPAQSVEGGLPEDVSGPLEKVVPDLWNVKPGSLFMAFMLLCPQIQIHQVSNQIVKLQILEITPKKIQITLSTLFLICCF